MTATTVNNVEAGNTFGNRAWIEETVQALHFLVVIGPLLLLFFVILVIASNIFLPTDPPPRWIIEAPFLLLVLNTLFLSIIPFVVAVIALQGYIGGGSANLLFFGCGMLSFSLASFVAGWLGAQAQANANLTIHNTGVLLASLFVLLSSIALFTKESPQKHGEKERKNKGILAYLGIILLIVVLSFAALRGYTPVFNVPGSGPTLLREAVLMVATIFFGLSCLLIVIFDRDRRSFFLSCYALALSLITIGLIALMTSKRTNSPLSWLGRSAQYAAGIYFLAAVVAAARTAWANRWTVPDTVRDFLRPSEALYRDLVQTATDAIIPISMSGEILLWDTPAEQMFGYNRMEALRLSPSDLIDPEDSKRLFQEIEAGTRSGKGFYRGKLREVKAHRKSGEEFPADLSFSSRRVGGGSISTLVIRDITELKRTEDEQARLLIAVREEKDRLSALVNSIQDEVWFADTEKNFTLVNPSGLHEFGLNGKTGIHVRELAESLEVYHPDGTPRPVEEAPPLRALRGEVVTNQEEMIRTPRTGELRFREVSATPVKDAGGHIIGSVSVVRDITERKRMEDELKRSRDELEMRVQERTEEIVKTNKALIAEISERKQAEEELLKSEQQLRRLSANLLTIQERERKRVSQELHDKIWQTLLAIKMDIADRKVEGEIIKTGEIVSLIQNTIETIRKMHGDLWPYPLDELGLLPTIEWFCREFQKNSPSIFLEKRLDLLEKEMPDSLKLVIFRVIQETLVNISKHSQANHAYLSLGRDDVKIELVIKDNGIGFDPDELFAFREVLTGLGLTSIRGQVEHSGGSFKIESRKGSGTVIQAIWLVNR